MSETRHSHEPVLVEQILELLDPKPGDVVLDGTVGLGGHATAILPRITPHGTYIGLDLDERMLAKARERLGTQGPGGNEQNSGSDAGVAVRLFHANYADFESILNEAGVEQVDRVLLDLGVNSAQIDDDFRGFSFDREGPLDMRFDRDQQRQAMDLVNGLPENDLADLIYKYGQEVHSRKIAKRICRVRHEQRITTTKVLARTVESVFTSAQGPARRGKIHPATRVFQALRIATNHELENLERFLERITNRLRVGGRIAVISFHSLEDGRVKRAFRTAKAAGVLEEITKRPLQAASEERAGNPRSRSAKLRVSQRVEATEGP